MRASRPARPCRQARSCECRQARHPARHRDERAAGTRPVRVMALKTVSIIANAHSERRILRRARLRRKTHRAKSVRRSDARSLRLGCGLRRSRRGRLSRKPSHPWPLVCGPSARRPALVADLPGDRTRRRQRRPDASRTSYRICSGPRPRRMPGRGRDGLCRSQLSNQRAPESIQAAKAR